MSPHGSSAPTLTSVNDRRKLVESRLKDAGCEKGSKQWDCPVCHGKYKLDVQMKDNRVSVVCWDACDIDAILIALDLERSVLEPVRKGERAPVPHVPGQVSVEDFLNPQDVFSPAPAPDDGQTDPDFVPRKISAPEIRGNILRDVRDQGGTFRAALVGVVAHGGITREEVERELDVLISTGQVTTHSDSEDPALCYLYKTGSRAEKKARKQREEMSTRREAVVRPLRLVPSSQLPKYDGVADHHAEMLRASAISPDVAKGTVKTRGTELVFLYYPPDPKERTREIVRPDSPRSGPDGRPMKYLSAKGERGMSVHPKVRAFMTDTSAPLVLVEGTKQNLAAVTALHNRAVCVVGMNGIRGWCWNPGKDARHEGSAGTPLPDWGHIPLKGRKVYVIPDGDWQTKEGVRKGAEALREFLDSRGAETFQVCVPLLPGQDSTGLDDFLGSLPEKDRPVELLRLMREAEEEPGDDLFVSREELDNLPPVEPLIDGMLNKSSVVWLSGKFGTYKTFLALSWALCVATGRPWSGRKVTSPGHVIYVAAEGHRGLSRRIAGWENGVNDGQRAEQITVTTRGIDPRDSTQMARLRKAVERTDAKMVVFDTLHRCTPGLEENSNAEAGEVFGAFQKLKDETGVAVVVLHHTGHEGTRARGASSMEDDADDAYVIKIDGEDRSPSNSRVLERRKSKEGEAGEKFSLTLQHDFFDNAYVTPDAFSAAAEPAGQTGPTPTMRLAKWLDSIGAPREKSRRDLQEWVMSEGFEYKATTLVWSAAVKMRKIQAGESVEN